MTQPIDLVIDTSWLDPLKTAVIDPCSKAFHEAVFLTHPAKQSNLLRSSFPRQKQPSFGVGGLPLVYLKTGSVRVFAPSTKGSYVLLNVDAVKVHSSFDDAVSRTVLSEKMYKLAERTGILGVPGSVVENRLYMLSVTSVSVCCGKKFSCFGFYFAFSQRHQQEHVHTLSITLKPVVSYGA